MSHQTESAPSQRSSTQPPLTAPSPHLFGNLRADLPAAVVVFFVALPLCLGIALASGAPLLSGIIAGVVGGVVVGALSGSSLGVSGPAAGLAVIVLTTVEQLGSFEIFLVAVVLAGILQLLLGFLRAGVIAYYFPSSVITGMLAGIGIIIFLKQLPHAVGYEHDPEGDFSFSQLDGETTFSELLLALERFSLGPLIIAAVSLLILMMWDHPRFAPIKRAVRLPGPLVAVVVSTALATFFADTPALALTTEQLVRIPVTEGFAGLAALVTFPNLSGLTMPAVYKAAVVIAVVGSLETLLCVEAADKLDPLKRVTPTNRELKAQGVGNIVSGLIGGLPITQVIVRSSANIQAGGKSKLSAIVHGLLLLLAVVLLPGVMNRVPLASLAAVLLLVGYKLAKPTLFVRLYREGWGQFIPFVATVLGIVFTDLLTGVGIGLAIGIIGLLQENYRLPFQLCHAPHERGEKVCMVLAQNVSFLNKASILQALNTIPSDTEVEIDGRGSVYVHADVIEIIDNFVVAAGARNIKVTVLGLGHHGKGKPGAGGEITVTPPGEST